MELTTDVMFELFKIPTQSRVYSKIRNRLLIETETPSHLTDTPKGYLLLTLLTNRRKLKW